MRVVFMGTPEIAVPSLLALAEAHEVAGVFCQPDKPVGRKQILTPPPVKQAAQRLGLAVFQPAGLRSGEAAVKLRALGPEVACVIAYGKILPQEMLGAPRFGCLNAHASLLPKYRGAAPIQRALEAGERETGVSLMQMDAGMDTGDVLLQRRVEINESDDAVSLFERLGALSAELFVEGLAKLTAGSLIPTPQDPAGASAAPPLKKSEGLFSWRQPADTIVNKARAFAIWPNAWFMDGGCAIKVFKAARSELSPGAPGEIVGLNPLVVSAGGGAVELLEVMPQNKKRMSGTAYAAGRRYKLGDIIKSEGNPDV